MQCWECKLRLRCFGENGFIRRKRWVFFSVAGDHTGYFDYFRVTTELSWGTFSCDFTAYDADFLINALPYSNRCLSNGMFILPMISWLSGSITLLFQVFRSLLKVRCCNWKWFGQLDIFTLRTRTFFAKFPSKWYRKNGQLCIDNY